MTDRFDSVIECVRAKFDQLITSPKHTVAHLPKEMPGPGIYLFSEGDEPLYVGRTNQLRRRLQSHTRNNHHQATFAFLLARHATGNLTATYKPKGSRADLLQDADFRAAFDAARKQIRSMDCQFVEERDPIKQIILEVFAAIRTEAKFNDFDNH
jgi:hypothetical protein